MNPIRNLKCKDNYGETTLGEWKDLFDHLVKEYGRDIKFDFVVDSCGDPFGVLDIKAENWEFERYCEEEQDYIEVEEKYMRLFLGKIV